MGNRIGQESQWISPTVHRNAIEKSVSKGPCFVPSDRNFPAASMLMPRILTVFLIVAAESRSGLLNGSSLLNIKKRMTPEAMAAMVDLYKSSTYSHSGHLMIGKPLVLLGGAFVCGEHCSSVESPNGGVCVTTAGWPNPHLLQRCPLCNPQL